MTNNVCGAQKRDGSGDDCQLPAGWGTDHVGEGRCKLHGGMGGAPTGPDNGAWKHGLNSEVLREDDQDMLDAIEAMSTAAKLEETLNLQIVKLYRAVEQMESENERKTFWGTFATLVEKVEDPSKEDLRNLAKMLGENDRAIREWMDLIRKTAKDLNKMAEGEDVNVSHEVESGQLDELKDSIADAYGDS